MRALITLLVSVFRGWIALQIIENVEPDISRLETLTWVYVAVEVCAAGVSMRGNFVIGWAFRVIFVAGWLWTLIPTMGLQPAGVMFGDIIFPDAALTLANYVVYTVLGFVAGRLPGDRYHEDA